MRLIIGMRARIKSGTRWDKKRDCCNKDVLLIQRVKNSSNSFSVLILGQKELIKKDPKTVINTARVYEDELEFVNSDFETNLNFIDWYQRNEDGFCGDCGEWRNNADTCPNEECFGRLYDSGLCPYCKTPKPKRGHLCKGKIDGKKCGFDWNFGV